MTFMPNVIAAEYRGGYRIHLRFNDNTAKVVDFGKWLQGPVFQLLKNPAYFRRFFVEAGTVVWPNGADIAPETLYQEKGVPVRRPNKRMQTSGAARKRSAARR